MSAEESPTLAGLLAEHVGYASERHNYGIHYVMVCDCGEWEQPDDGSNDADHAAHREHVAQVVLTWIAEKDASIAAEAREAALEEAARAIEAVQEEREYLFPQRRDDEIAAGLRYAVKVVRSLGADS